MLRQITQKITAVGTSFAVLALSVVAGSVSLARSARAQGSTAAATSQNPAAPAMFVEYAAKFVCGIPTVEARREAVKPGNYATAINIHNPNQLPATQPIPFTKHAIIALPEGTGFIPPSQITSDRLPSDFAMEVDCENIRKFLSAPPAPAFIKGFVVILTPSPNNLDVVGVYSAEPPPNSTGSIGGIGLEVLPITPRTISK